jgi:hypothetical protein
VPIQAAGLFGGAGILSPMICIECNKHLNDCECPDIEDRLLNLIADGNAQAQEWAKRAWNERAISQRQKRDGMGEHEC